MTTTIYEFDPDTNEYTGVYFEDYPKNPQTNTYDTGPTMTVEVPPSVNPNEIQVFDTANNVWNVLPDYRNETWYHPDGTEEYYSDIGQAPSAGMTSTKPFVIDEAYRLKLQELSLACSGEIYENFTSSVLGTEHFYNLGSHDQTNLTALVSAANAKGVAGEPYKFMCSDNPTTPENGVWARRDHTTQQILDLQTEVLAFIDTCLDKHLLRRQEMDVATTQAEFDAIVWV